MAMIKYGYDVNYIKLESYKEYNLSSLIEELKRIDSQLHEGNANVNEFVVSTNSEVVIKIYKGSL